MHIIPKPTQRGKWDARCLWRIFQR